MATKKFFNLNPLTKPGPMIPATEREAFTAQPNKPAQELTDAKGKRIETDPSKPLSKPRGDDFSEHGDNVSHMVKKNNPYNPGGGATNALATAFAPVADYLARSNIATPHAAQASNYILNEKEYDDPNSQISKRAQEYISSVFPDQDLSRLSYNQAAKFVPQVQDLAMQDWREKIAEQHRIENAQRARERAVEAAKATEPEKKSAAAVDNVLNALRQVTPLIREGRVQVSLSDYALMNSGNAYTKEMFQNQDYKDYAEKMTTAVYDLYAAENAGARIPTEKIAAWKDLYILKPGESGTDAVHKLRNFTERLQRARQNFAGNAFTDDLGLEEYAKSIQPRKK